jgi:hypothetical protein
VLLRPSNSTYSIKGCHATTAVPLTGRDGQEFTVSFDLSYDPFDLWWLQGSFRTWTTISHFDNAIEWLSCEEDEQPEQSARRLLHSWLLGNTSPAAETIEELSTREVRQLVFALRGLRQSYIDDAQGRVGLERFLKRCEKLRRWLRSFSFALSKFHCSSESFCMGSAAEFDRGRHFLTVSFRFASQLWSRVIAALTKPVSASAVIGSLAPA